MNITAIAIKLAQKLGTLNGFDELCIDTPRGRFAFWRNPAGFDGALRSEFLRDGEKITPEEFVGGVLG